MVFGSKSGAFCRDSAYKLITLQSLLLKLYGWDTIADLIDAAQEVYCPPLKCFVVLGAGTGFVDGLYMFAANLTGDGYVVSWSEIRYECNVPIVMKKDADGKVKKKKITLFWCTMRSQQKWWFLSEVDEHQPGTDKDFDFYQHKAKKDENKVRIEVLCFCLIKSDTHLMSSLHIDNTGIMNF